jgi:MSHA biogenesis protein MshG
MPAFAYTARDATGSKVEGVLDTPDANALADALSAQGLLLIRAEPQLLSAGTESLAQLRDRWLGSRVDVVALMMFCRQMGTLLKAGVPLLRALQALQESATQPRMARVLADVRSELESGREFSAALRQHATVFSTYIVNMVRVGEMTGRLPDVFNGLHAQLAFVRDSREQVRSALRYPLFVIATAVAALIAVNVFVIPSFARVYRSAKADLPALTQALMAISDVLVAGWPALLAGAALGAFGLRAALRTDTGRRVRDGLLLKAPIIGPLVHKAALARFTRSFGLALEAGVPLVDALQVAAETADNVVLAGRIALMRHAAERGESLARAARSTGVFNPTVLQMIAVGEETGALADMMNEVAVHFQREVDYTVKSLGSQLEPVLILFLGGFILVFALGVFLPLWDLSRVALR